MKRPHGQIKWKDQPITLESVPHLVNPSEASKSLEAQWEEHLYVGALWRLVHQMDVRKDIKTGTPYLKRDLYDVYPGHPVHSPKGSLAIYAGTERMNEMAKVGPVRILRHSFIINGGRYIITDFINIEPVLP